MLVFIYSTNILSLYYVYGAKDAVLGQTDMISALLELIQW
jgi:hypothetical protein